MVDWLYSSIADKSRVVNHLLSLNRTIIRSISDSLIHPDLGRSSSDVSSSRNLLNQSQQVQSTTVPLPSAAHIRQVAALALFPNHNW